MFLEMNFILLNSLELLMLCIILKCLDLFLFLVDNILIIDIDYFLLVFIIKILFRIVCMVYIYIWVYIL